MASGVGEGERRRAALSDELALDETSVTKLNIASQNIVIGGLSVFLLIGLLILCLPHFYLYTVRRFQGEFIKLNLKPLYLLKSLPFEIQYAAP
jgi:hypothetical protein